MQKKPNWPKRIAVFTGELALILVLMLALEAWLTRDAASGTHPPLAGATLEGAAFDLARERGELVLVYFWASWCPTCRASESTMAGLAEDRPVVSVAMQSGSDAEVRGYLAERELALPVLNDPDGRIAADWGVRAVPASFVVDPNGEIRFSTRGYSTSWGLRARLWLAEWMAG